MTEANGVVDEGFLRRYRQLLDAEDTAFDELEHAYEDGDRPHFDEELELWQQAIVKRIDFLRKKGIEIPGLSLTG
jgi:hypothetical protein